MVCFCLSVFLITPAIAEESDLETHFREYIGNWKPEADIDEIVSAYWDSRVTVFPPGQSAVHLADPGETSGMLTSTMLPVIEAGWQKSSVVGFSSCRLSENVAIVGIEYQRSFTAGKTTTDKAVYIVRSDQDGWKIQALMSSETHKITC